MLFHFARYIILFFSVVFAYHQALYSEVLEWGSLKQNFENNNAYHETEIFRAKDATQDVRLKKASYHIYSASRHNLFYLDFENQYAESLQDETGQLVVHKANYFPSSDVLSGKKSALFNGHQHGVWVAPVESRIIGKEEMHDFTIEMRLKPIFLHNKSILLEKITRKNGEKSGIEIGIQRGYVFVNLMRLFEGLNGEKFSLKIQSSNLIQLKRWQHFAISYHAASGRIALYLNGKEESIRFAKSKDGLWKFKFPLFEPSYLKLASLYIGFIDDFRIASRALSPEKDELNVSPFPALSINFETQNGTQQNGYVHSSLHELPQQKISRFSQFSYLASEPEGTVLHIYVRYSKRPFSPQKKEIPQVPWKRVTNQILTLPTMRYFQWKAVLRSDPLGQETPILHSIKLSYTPVQSPPVPQNIAIIHELSDDKSVCLEWEISSIQDAKARHGYYIYYGLRSGDYIGRLSFYIEGREAKLINNNIKKFPMTSSEKQTLISQPGIIKKVFHNRIRLIIDNKLIKKNISLNPKRPLPLLEPGTNYYFAISTYDDLSESELSKEAYIITNAN